MKTTASHWIAMLCALACVLAMGCAGVITPNVWTFHKSNVRSTAWTNFFGACPRYGSITIGTPEKPFFKSPPLFSIRLADGRTLVSTELSLETLRSSVEYAGQASESWPKGSVIYGNLEFAFFFVEGRLFKFEADVCHDKAGVKHMPVIGTYDKSHFYAMPLTHEQLIEIFGKPDFVKKERFQ